MRTFSWIFAVQMASWGKRLLDILLSALLLVLLSPLLLLGYVLSGFSVQRTSRLGRWLEPFGELSFGNPDRPAGSVAERLRLHRLPALWNIFKGDMSFIGPLAVAPGAVDLKDKDVRRRFQARPGLISLWWIRQRANIAYDTEARADSEYLDTQGIWNDLGIALRAVPAILYGDGVNIAPDRVTVLGVPIDNLTMTEALDQISEWLDQSDPKQVCFLNADCANIAYKNPEYLKALRETDLCLADGIGLKLAGKILAQEIKQNVNGTDMFPRLCERLSEQGRRLFLLGARPEVVDGVAEWVGERFPDIVLCGKQHGYFKAEEEESVIVKIESARPDLLLVAFGAPRQDLWIHGNLKRLDARVAMGVGGLFDFYSGRIPRAPLWMREIGMEWVYRLVQEPGRLWKRYLVGNGVFLWRVAAQRFFPRSSRG